MKPMGVGPLCGEVDVVKPSQRCCWFCGSKLSGTAYDRASFGVSKKIKAGLMRAKQKGKTLGARKRDDINSETIISLKNDGYSWRAIALLVGAPKSTIREHALELGFNTGHKQYMEETRWLRDNQKQLKQLKQQLRQTGSAPRNRLDALFKSTIFTPLPTLNSKL